MIVLASLDVNSPSQGYALLAVGLGGGCGALLRSLSAYAFLAVPLPIPFSTLLVNMCGSFLVGLSSQLFALSSSSWTFYHDFFITGFLGGLTTFSTLMLESVLLMEDGCKKEKKETKHQDKPYQNGKVAEPLHKQTVVEQGKQMQVLEAARADAEEVTLPDKGHGEYGKNMVARAPLMRFSSRLLESPIFWGVFNVVVHNVLCIALVFLGLAIPTGFNTTLFNT